MKTYQLIQETLIKNKGKAVQNSTENTEVSLLGLACLVSEQAVIPVALLKEECFSLHRVYMKDGIVYISRDVVGPMLFPGNFKNIHQAISDYNSRQKEQPNSCGTLENILTLEPFPVSVVTLPMDAYTEVSDDIEAALKAASAERVKLVSDMIDGRVQVKGIPADPIKAPKELVELLNLMDGKPPLDESSLVKPVGPLESLATLTEVQRKLNEEVFDLPLTDTAMKVASEEASYLDGLDAKELKYPITIKSQDLILLEKFEHPAPDPNKTFNPDFYSIPDTIEDELPAISEATMKRITLGGGRLTPRGVVNDYPFAGQEEPVKMMLNNQEYVITPPKEVFKEDTLTGYIVDDEAKLVYHYGIVTASKRFVKYICNAQGFLLRRLELTDSLNVDFHTDDGFNEYAKKYL